MIRNSAFVLLMFVFIAGFGPCEVPESETSTDGENDTSNDDCENEDCTDELILDVLRVENQSFPVGVYKFEVTVLDETQTGGDTVWVGCELYFEGEDIECLDGMTEYMDVSINASGTKISLKLTGAPLNIKTTLQYNGYIIGQRDITPLYTDVAPASCDFSCMHAKESIPVAIY